jgi:hypothetical protein
VKWFWEASCQATKYFIGQKFDDKKWSEKRWSCVARFISGRATRLQSSLTENIFSLNLNFVSYLLFGDLSLAI